MLPYSDTLAALINGRPVTWDSLGTEPAPWLEACAAEGVSALVYRSVKRFPSGYAWPERVVEGLARAAHAEAAAEIVRAAELRETLDSLAESGIQPLVLKGASLAYTIYAEPALRPRGDTDIFLREDALDSARRVLAARGYHARLGCDDLFSQFEVRKSGVLGVVHVVDVHWKISTQPTFANLLSYDELLRDAVSVSALGAHACTAGPLHALLLACVHPVMHHQNVESLLWTYDVHLLASGLPAPDLEAFAELARRKDMAAVCERQLRLAQRMYGTAIPSSVFSKLVDGRGTEPSSIYLRAGRRWHHDFLSSLRALPEWTSRGRHLRGVLFPSPAYVLGSYGLRYKPLGLLALPALYMHRNVRGAWKVLTGRK